MKRSETDAIKRRVEAATAGPWVRFRPDPCVGNFWVEGLPGGSEAIATDSDAGGQVIAATTGRNQNDREFITASRADVPRLLADIDELRAKVERLNAAVRLAGQTGEMGHLRESVEVEDWRDE